MSDYLLFSDYRTNLPLPVWNKLVGDLGFDVEGYMNAVPNGMDIEWVFSSPRRRKDFFIKNGFSRELGKGSSRIVFESTNASSVYGKVVLKGAIRPAGLAQNGREIEFFEEFEHSHGLSNDALFPIVFAWDEFDRIARDSFWVLCEKCFKFGSPPLSFKGVVGVSFEMVSAFFLCYSIERENYDNGRSYLDAFDNKDDEYFRKYFSLKKFNFEVEDGLFGKKFSDFVSKYLDFANQYPNVIVNDWLSKGQWGYTYRNGKPHAVLADFGFTQSVFEEHYKNRWVRGPNQNIFWNNKF